jgi:hypothetical protein
MRTGADAMAETHETPGAGEPKGIHKSPLVIALQPAPARFTLMNFGARLRRHLIAYAIILTSAVYACAFVFAPLEMSVISLMGIAVAVCIALFFSPSRQRLRRLVEGGIAASYIVGAAILMKAFDAIFRM